MEDGVKLVTLSHSAALLPVEKMGVYVQVGGSLLPVVVLVFQSFPRRCRVFSAPRGPRSPVPFPRGPARGGDSADGP